MPEPRDAAETEASSARGPHAETEASSAKDPHAETEASSVRDLYAEIASLRARGEPAALATVIRVRGSSPGKAAMKMLVRADGSFLGSVGGGRLEADVLEAAREVLADEKARLLDLTLKEEHLGGSGLLCGGRVEVFVESLTLPVLILCGGGHVSLAVARIADLAGFCVTVLDDREEFSNPRRFPMAAECRAGPFGEILSGLAVGTNSYVVIVTRGHLEDRACLEWALRTPARYVGMIGSKRKIRKIFDDCREAGFTDEELATVHAPIGLAIGARTAEEIGVAIVAEMISCRRGARPPRGGGGERDPGSR